MISSYQRRVFCQLYLFWWIVRQNIFTAPIWVDCGVCVVVRRPISFHHTCVILQLYHRHPQYHRLPHSRQIQRVILSITPPPPLRTQLTPPPPLRARLHISQSQRLEHYGPLSRILHAVEIPAPQVEHNGSKQVRQLIINNKGPSGSLLPGAIKEAELIDIFPLLIILWIYFACNFFIDQD